MIIEADIRTHLLGIAEITALVSQRVFTYPLREGITVPAITIGFDGQAGQPAYKDGVINLYAGRLRASAWAKRFYDARKIADLLHAALDNRDIARAGAPISCLGIDNSFARYDNDLELHECFVATNIFFNRTES